MSTTEQVRDVVLSFLSARDAALKSQPVVQEADKDESQDDYGEFSFDFNDPAILAMTGVETPSVLNDQVSPDRKTAEVHAS